MSFLGSVRRGMVAWGKTEGSGWLFVLKTTIAALLALWVSMRLEFGQPATAMLTVYIVMHPQNGMVLTKSFYRICGTLAGAVASLVLLGMFAQERVLFLLGVAIWIGVCTAGSALYRNFKSYGFTLAGYTAAMICLPLVMQPTGFFDYAVNRATEIVIGILCAGIVSGVVFPKSLGDSVERTIQSRYAEFVGFARGMLSGGMDSREINRMHLRFIGNAVNLESLRSAVVLEASATRAHDVALRRLNRDFMALSTTFHSLYQLLNRLKRGGAPATQALTSLCESLVDLLLTDGEPARTAEQAHQAARRCAAFRGTFSQQVAMVRQTYAPIADRQTELDCETALELLNRFDRELHDYTRTYGSLAADSNGLGTLEEIRFASRTDPALAFLTGARATVAILLMSAFWIASAWPSGSSAVMMAAIGCALFALVPDPAGTVKVGIIGAIGGFISAMLCKYFVLTSLDGFGLMCAGMVPFMLVGPYLMLNPKLAGLGSAYNAMLCFIVSPANTMLYDPVSSVNFASALMLGLAAAAVIFVVFAPTTGVWPKRRTARLLRRQVELACFGSLSSLADRFESGTRDILQRLAAQQNVKDGHDENLLAWMFVVLEIGRAVIHLRQDAALVSLSQPALDGVKKTVESTARLFRKPDWQRQVAALEQVKHSIETIVLESDREGLSGHSRDAMRRMLASLHLIRTSLQDDKTILAAAVAGPQANLQGEKLYAA